MTMQEPLTNTTDAANGAAPAPATPPPAASRDAAFWATDAGRLKVGEVPAGAVNINVEGRRVVGPLQGFGPMWQKTYSMRLEGVPVTPAAVIQNWKANFPTFWPKGNRFYPSITGIAPGEVALLRLSVAGMPLSTGVMVLYADDESFTLMTPEGHAFAGWITFSAFAKDGATVAQAQVLMRANDPIYELGLRFGGHRAENNFWRHTISAVAATYGVRGKVNTQVTCIDRRIQWRHARNLRQNGMMLTVLYTAGAPFRLVARPFRRSRR
ncbi:MAG TPA: hypothetical protein VGR57_21235 [Ktedonobacterales bacterium]|nr:hypothetical protein [Ktedonobacterales bacterium]